VGDPRRVAFRRSAAVVAATALSMTALAACGPHNSGASVGQLVDTPAPTTVSSPSKKPEADSVAPSPSAPDDGPLKGGGTFVYDDGGVVATVQLPADGSQEDVRGLKDFLRRSHSPKLRIVSVTVTNHSSKTFPIKGFEIHGTTGTIPLYPAGTFVNLAMARPGVSSRPDLASAGTIVALTSAITIPPGRELTTLVGTQGSVQTITDVFYQRGSTSIRLRPLWEIRQAAAKVAREQAKAAKKLARQQAAAARKRARQRAATAGK
jgi:hypothetical protein